MLTEEIRAILRERGADCVRFVELAGLPAPLAQGFPRAVLIGLPLPREYVRRLSRGLPAERDEFLLNERAADALADRLAEELKSRGFRARSQSGKSNDNDGCFDPRTRSSLLPHKTVARLAGLGWIGRTNLLVTKEYGCAFCMSTVLTDAPLPSENNGPSEASPSLCGSCQACRDACPTGALSGGDWTVEGGRDALVDVEKCTCCLRCMMCCPCTLRRAGGPETANPAAKRKP